MAVKENVDREFYNFFPRGMGISGGGVLPNPDPILDQKMSFFTPIFRAGLQNPLLFPDQTSRITNMAYMFT